LPLSSSSSSSSKSWSPSPSPSSMKIFNEYRSLTRMGELNPYWRSSMNVEYHHHHHVDGNCVFLFFYPLGN
jgi:hypothetical protein